MYSRPFFFCLTHNIPILSADWILKGDQNSSSSTSSISSNKKNNTNTTVYQITMAYEMFKDMLLNDTNVVPGFTQEKLGRFRSHLAGHSLIWASLSQLENQTACFGCRGKRHDELLVICTSHNEYLEMHH